MDPTKILFFRNLLFRCLLLGLAFAFILIGGTILFRDVWMPMAAGMFRLEEAEVMEVVLASLLNIRLILIFFFLTPALALHWMAKGQK